MSPLYSAEKKKLSLPKNIKAMGYIPMQKMYTCYRHCSFWCVYFTTENYSTVSGYLHTGHSPQSFNDTYARTVHTYSFPIYCTED